MTEARHALGVWGEDVAASFLEKHGFVVLERNVRTRYGELDIVARDGEELVFVEVRTKSHIKFGHPFETIGPKKIFKLRNMARWYLQARKLGESVLCRFDAIAIVGSPESTYSIEHIRNVVF